MDHRYIVGALAGAALCLVSLTAVNEMFPSPRHLPNGDKIFTPAGVYDYTAPADATNNEVTCFGAGGGGGDAGPGGAGEQMFGIFPSPHGTIRITIGAGGHDGLPGGNTSFGNFLVAHGGGSQVGRGSAGSDGACVVKETLKGKG